MTAFANSEAEIALLALNCEIRSVNHRYCDISLKLPERLRFSEAEIRKAISQKIKRGKIECSLSYKKQNQNTQSLIVDMQAVKLLLSATAKIEQQMQSPQSFSALEILTFPGVQLEQEIDQENLKQGIDKLILQTLRQLLKVREREGKQLGVLLEDRCQRMQQQIESAKMRMPEVMQNSRNKLIDSIHGLELDPDVDRLEQELIYLLQKLDVDEELDRLETHVNEVQRILQQDEPMGRRLDFLLQEMNREANTLGSKSADKEITQIAIELKVLIEQMREQVQNIE